MDKEEDYKKLLEIAPPHNSSEFIEFLRKYNPVVMETKYWIVIENFKHHTTTTPHYTVFPLSHAEEWGDLSGDELSDLRDIFDKYNSWYKIQNEDAERTVSRLHIHLIKNYDEYVKKIAGLIYGEEIIQLFEELKVRRPNLYQGIIAGLQRDSEKTSV